MARIMRRSHRRQLSGRHNVNVRRHSLRVRRASVRGLDKGEIISPQKITAATQRRRSGRVSGRVRIPARFIIIES